MDHPPGVVVRTFPPRVARWGDLVRQVAPDLDPSLVLALIWHESGGQVGIIGKGKTKTAKLKTKGGDLLTVDRALGLMQVIPPNIKAHNDRGRSPFVFYEDMTGTSSRAAKIQIQLGTAIFRSALLSLHQFDPVRFPFPKGPPTTDQNLIALMIYAYGFGNVRPLLVEIKQANIPITFATIAARWPQFGWPKNRPVQFAQWVMQKVTGRTFEQTQPATKRAGAGGLLLVAAFLAWTWSKQNA